MIESNRAGWKGMQMEESENLVGIIDFLKVGIPLKRKLS